MSGPTTSRLLSVAEFAALIGRAERQVRRFVNRGEVRATTEEVNGRTVVRIPEEEVQKFIREDGSSRPDAPAELSGLDADAVEVDGAQVFDSPEMVSGQPPQAQPNVRSEVVMAEVVEVDAQPVSGRSGQVEVVMSGPEPREAANTITAGEILARYESAAVRLGWVEGQLEMTRKMLGDGGQRVEELRRQEEELRRRLESETEARRLAETRAAEAQARLEVLERLAQRSWWHKLFRS